MKKNIGFTLLELLITVALVAILLTSGVPALTQLVKNNNLVSKINRLNGFISLARAEAVKRGNVNITLCRSDNNNTCNDSGNNLIIFPDVNGNGAIDSAIFDKDGDGNNTTDILVPAELLIKTQSIVTSGITLKIDDFNNNRVVFNSTGQPNGIGTFILCDDRKEPFAKAIIMNISGQIRQATDDGSGNGADDNSIVQDIDGVDIRCD